MGNPRPTRSHPLGSSKRTKASQKASYARQQLHFDLEKSGMIGEILLSLLIPLGAWMAYGQLQFVPNQAFRWGLAHVVSFAWLQLGAQILLTVGYANPMTLGAWICLSSIWVRPCAFPRIPEMGLYLCLFPYLMLALVPPWYRDSLTYHLTLPKLFAQTQGYTAGDEIIFGYFPDNYFEVMLPGNVCIRSSCLGS